MTRQERKKIRYAEVRALCHRVLGGACAKCGSTSDLEIDHIDPRSKAFSPLEYANLSDARHLAELSKCQLLCEACHIAKSIVDHGFAPPGHGKPAMYAGGCRCQVCVKASRDRNREHQWRRRRAAGCRVNTIYPEHATQTMYRLGCRCYFCMEYKNGLNRLRRARNRS